MEMKIEGLGLDPGIERYVSVLMEAGIETTESCQGGKGHTYPEPAIKFCGDYSEGFRALAAATQAQLPVSELRRVWTIQGEEPHGPEWEMVFYSKTKPGPWTPVGFE